MSLSALLPMITVTSFIVIVGMLYALSVGTWKTIKWMHAYIINRNSLAFLDEILRRNSHGSVQSDVE